jgi:predicted CXXCH cytochrome family protein
MLSERMSTAFLSRVAIAWLVSLLVAGAAQTVNAGFVGGAPSLMQSQGPCLFSMQLKSSVEERRRYLVRLGKATGEAVASSSAVEDMYNNITPASYSAEEPPTASELWDLGLRKAVVNFNGVDALSKDCMSCHDGGGAVLIEANWKNNPSGMELHARTSGSDHPIGMDYQRYVAANGRKYKQVFGLSSKMVFIDGKVGCLTCHDPLNPERKHLVMSDRNSALCLTCHNT